MKRFSLEFSLNGFKFDLLPACDFDVNQKAKNWDSNQQMEVLKRMKRNKGEVSALSASLAFSVLNFIKKKSSYVHDIIRLAKYWFKSLSLDEYVYGGKYCIELVAIQAAEEVERDEDITTDTHFYGFLWFLEYMKNFDEIYIMFPGEYGPCNGKHKPPPFGKRATPFVLDPTNPYNDLAVHFSRDAIKYIMEQADETINSLSGGSLEMGQRRAEHIFLYNDEPTFLPTWIYNDGSSFKLDRLYDRRWNRDYRDIHFASTMFPRTREITMTSFIFIWRPFVSSSKRRILLGMKTI